MGNFRIAAIAAAAAGVLLAPAFDGREAQAQTQAQAPVSYVQPLSPQAQREVQRQLKELGVYSGAVDGIWGRDSQEALERFQQTRGLQVTSNLNQATLATMGLKPAELLSLGDQTGAMAGRDVQGRALKAEAVRTIQGRLKQLGLYAGDADGIWGDSTQAALERFQRDRGLQASGRLDPNTLTTMGLDSNVVLAQTR
jgi:peptidoglycan hydrolase-like protein with peptidoglycan-binding domain